MVFEIASNNRQRHSPRAFKVPVSTHRSSNLNNPTSLSTSLLPYPHQIMIPSQDKPTPRETVPVLNINVLLLSVSASSDLLRAAQDLVHRVSKRVRNTTIIRAKALPGSTTKVISSKQVRITLHAVLILPYSKPLSVEAAAHLDTLRTIPDIILRIHPIISMQASGYGQTLYRALHTGQLGEIAHTLSQAAFVLPSESNEQGPIELSLGLMRAFVDVISQLLCSHLALSNATRFRFQAMLGRPTITIYLGAGEDRMRSADEEQLVTRAIRIANASVKLLNRNAAAYLGAVGLEELGQDKHPELAHRPTHATPSSSARPRTANVSASCSGPSRDPVARTPSPELLRTAPGSAPVFLVARLDCGIDIRVGEPSPGASASPPPPAYPAQPGSSGAHVPQHTPSPYRALADRREDPKPRTRPPRRPHTAAQVENVQHVTPALRFLKPLERTAPLLACHHISAPLTPSPPSPPPQAPIIITHPVEGTPEAYKIPVLSHFPEKAYRVLGHHHLQTRSHYIKSATLRNPLSSRSRTSDEKVFNFSFPFFSLSLPSHSLIFVVCSVLVTEGLVADHCLCLFLSLSIQSTFWIIDDDQPVLSLPKKFRSGRRPATADSTDTCVSFFFLILFSVPVHLYTITDPPFHRFFLSLMNIYLPVINSLEGFHDYVLRDHPLEWCFQKIYR